MKFTNPFRKKSWIRFYSLEPAVTDLYPIKPASNHKRSWVQGERKKSKCPVSGLISTANCPGIKNLMSSGYIVPAPADFKITTNGDGISVNWEAPWLFKMGGDKRSYIGKHDETQVEPLLDDPSKSLKTVVKIETPWRVKASDDIVLLQLPVNYNNEKRFTAATGLLDPRYGHVIHAQLFWHVLEGETHVKAGTPLIQYIPMQRKYLQNSNFETIIDSAGDVEWQMEESFEYANQSQFIAEDTVQNRLNRVMTVFNKYRNKGFKL